MIFNYKLTIEYDGSRYAGWQRQKKNSNTIQQQIEDALEILLKRKIVIIGSGRTDAGVHAFNQIANFPLDKLLPDMSAFKYSLNSLLPKDITIKNIQRVNENFHSRYSAVNREYIYQISLRDISLYRQYFHKISYDLDFNFINQFIPFLTGYKSFKSLCKNTEDKHDFMCNLYSINFKYLKSKKIIIFKINSSRFLHSMVRAVLGCLIDIGRGKLDLQETKNNFEKGIKIKTTYLPSNALFLNKIYYK